MNTRTYLAGAALLLLSACAADERHHMMADGKGCQMMPHGKANDDHAKGGMPKGRSMDGCGMMREKDGPPRDDRHAHPSP